jgi:hypothetical protein
LFWPLFALVMGFVLGGSFYSAYLFTPPPKSATHDQAPDKCSAEQSKNHGFWEKADCDPVAYFTLWLVGFTGVLAVSTIILAVSTIALWVETRWAGSRQASEVKASIAVAAKAAKAAESSAEALMRAERARIFVELERQNISAIIVMRKDFDNVDVDNPSKIGEKPYIGYVLRNHGKTPAILKEISCALVFGMLPAEPDYSMHVFGIPLSIGGDRASEVVEHYDPAFMTVGEAERLYRAYVDLWFYIRVVYEDSFGAEQESRFLWQYDPGVEDFYPDYSRQKYNERT